MQVHPGRNDTSPFILMKRLKLIRETVKVRPDRAEALSDAFVWRLSVAYIGPNSRTVRHRKTKIGTEVAHLTHDSDTTFKVKGQLVADVLNSQHAGTGAEVPPGE